MRSLPPPIASRRPYSASYQATVQPCLGERLVERRPVAVALGVREDAVAVEDQRGQADQAVADSNDRARPAEPKIRM